MDIIFSIFKYLGLGLVALIVIAILFGKRVRKQWEYEAEFRDEASREFGEFDVEMSRIEKEEPEYTLKAKFHMRHPAIRQHQTVQVYVDDLLVLEGLAAEEGYIRLGNDHLQATIDEPLLDKQCRIVVGGEEVVSQALKPD
jgi:hypothetical protein